jgi:methyl-accepting chemotaxis protein
MEKKNAQFMGVLAIATMMSIVEIIVTFVWLRQGSVPASVPLVRTGIASLLFAVAVFAIVGRYRQAYITRYDELSADAQAYHTALRKLGDVPVKALSLFLLIQTTFLAGLFLAGDFFAIQSSIAFPAFFEILSLGMLNAAMVFVQYDRLSTRLLSSQKLTAYPASLRSNRQEVKIFVIPVFIAVMSMMFAFSIPFLIGHASDGNGSVKTSSILKAAVAFVTFLTMLIVLIRTWNGTTAMAYRAIIGQLDKIASGEKDLTGRVFVASIDELGTIAGLTNTFCGALERDIDDLKNIQRHLMKTGISLNESEQNSVTALKQLGAEITNIEEGNRNQTDSIIASTAAVRQISRNIESLDGQIAEQSASVTEASASIEEMVGTIESINASIIKMASEFGLLEKAAKEGSSLQELTVTQINAIAEKSAALAEANKVISAIASQTNLLAMNAAIEAAHAGQAGLGFSVVADEIRRLAETSANESKIIKKVLREVQTSIEDVVVAAKKNAESFGNVAGKIATTDNLVREVNMAVSEQSEGASQILEALKQMNDITVQVKTGSKEMNEGITDISKEMDVLQAAAQAFSASIREITSGADIIGESAKRVNGAVSVTNQTIGSMNDIISRFTTSQTETA